MSRSASPYELREAIAAVIWDKTKAYETEGACDAVGMPKAPDDADGPWSSKTVYVRTRLSGCPRSDLEVIARRVADEYSASDELGPYLAEDGFTGVKGELKNLIFAADGPKPKIVLRDSVNNVIEIVENARHCLVYDRPLGQDGLTWQMLVDWWREHRGDFDSDRDAARNLYERLVRSLQGNAAEKLVLQTYAERYRPEGGFQLPALIPQVYLYYDPYTKKELGENGQVLNRQRMDFLMLMPNDQRVVIEVDGRQHYSSGDNLENPDPGLYADMVREDRALRLRGYEVYRFGGAELAGNHGVQAVREFFDALLARHS